MFAPSWEESLYFRWTGRGHLLVDLGFHDHHMVRILLPVLNVEGLHPGLHHLHLHLAGRGSVRRGRFHILRHRRPKHTQNECIRTCNFSDTQKTNARTCNVRDRHSRTQFVSRFMDSVQLVSDYNHAQCRPPNSTGILVSSTTLLGISNELIGRASRRDFKSSDESPSTSKHSTHQTNPPTDMIREREGERVAPNDDSARFSWCQETRRRVQEHTSVSPPRKFFQLQGRG